MYLELAESYPVRGYRRRAHSVKKHRRTLSEDSQPLYIFVPDLSGVTSGTWVREDYFDYLPESEFIALMNELEQYQPEEGLLAAGWLNKLLPGRAERVAQRQEKRDAKTNIKLAKAEAIRSGTYTSPIQTFFEGITGTAKAIMGGGSDSADEKDLVDKSGASGGGGGSFFKNPLVIVGGLALLGTGIWYVTKKK